MWRPAISFAATNPRGIVSADRANCLSMIGCNGYLSSDNPVVTTDPLFVGGILIQGCAFHRPDRESEVAVIGNPRATVSIDTSSFFDVSEKGLNAVRGRHAEVRRTDDPASPGRRAGHPCRGRGSQVPAGGRLAGREDFPGLLRPGDRGVHLPLRRAGERDGQGSIGAQGEAVGVSRVEVLRNGGASVLSQGRGGRASRSSTPFRCSRRATPWRSECAPLHPWTLERRRRHLPADHGQQALMERGRTSALASDGSGIASTGFVVVRGSA